MPDSIHHASASTKVLFDNSPTCQLAE